MRRPLRRYSRKQRRRWKLGRKPLRAEYALRYRSIFRGRGFSRGFKEAGFEILAAVENFKPKAKTYRTNFPEVKLYVEDIKRLNPAEILREVGRPDVIIGGPPCEPFTAINPRRRERAIDRLYRDPIGRLVLYFIRFVEVIRPEIFVMEQVPQIMELEDALRREFKKAGYDVHFNILNALDYGVPQVRRRVFVSNVEIRPKSVKGKRAVWEAIRDVPPMLRTTSPGSPVVG
ncbi:DNA cytosine methyltransferase [Pyrococcus yayanosii]|nr:DNA cytosine methyltransferase [Pyrococcus yayanosii]